MNMNDCLSGRELTAAKNAANQYVQALEDEMMSVSKRMNEIGNMRLAVCEIYNADVQSVFGESGDVIIKMNNYYYALSQALAKAKSDAKKSMRVLMQP